MDERGFPLTEAMHRNFKLCGRTRFPILSHNYCYLSFVQCLSIDIKLVIIKVARHFTNYYRIFQQKYNAKNPKKVIIYVKHLRGTMRFEPYIFNRDILLAFIPLSHML